MGLRWIDHEGSLVVSFCPCFGYLCSISLRYSKCVVPSDINLFVVKWLSTSLNPDILMQMYGCMCQYISLINWEGTWWRLQPRDFSAIVERYTDKWRICWPTSGGSYDWMGPGFELGIFSLAGRLVWLGTTSIDMDNVLAVFMMISDGFFFLKKTVLLQFCVWAQRVIPGCHLCQESGYTRRCWDNIQGVGTLVIQPLSG